MRPDGKARRARIPGVFERGATQPDPGPPTRQPRWGGGGMQRRPNAAGVSPRAAMAAVVVEPPHVDSVKGRRCAPPAQVSRRGGFSLPLSTKASCFADYLAATG